ncbi:Abi-alpha family protein [Nocardioides jensenii]|uniref:Abi-alpha family protein n=1 Tax=Nocardioides jensenii TaxID=1843 RepID=UPI000A5BF7ED|nr:Abi-alpha family protein [Nocardioides jensenii]
MTDDKGLERADHEQSPALDAIPGLIRIAASSWVRTAEWSVVAGIRTGRRVLKAATDPHTAVELAQGAAAASGIVADIAKAVSSGESVPQAIQQVAASLGGTTDRKAVVPHNGRDREIESTDLRSSLREQGAKLLERSRDVWSNETGHPAYARILTELAPDEGRILMLLLRSGPQPMVDVRTGGAVGMVSSTLIAPGLNMIGPRAGTRYVDQVPSYLNNLFRLGLVWFSKEQLKDPLDYQVVEAQPDVLAAMHSVRSAKLVRRSIHLTPFGEDFCRTCLLEDETPTEDLPVHQAPNDLE